METANKTNSDIFEECTFLLQDKIDKLKTSYEEASFFLEKLGFYDLPKREDKTYDFYSGGAFINSPLLNYLIDNKYYESHGSSDDDYGVILKPIFGIPINSFVRIEPVSETKFKITRVVENMTEKLYNVICEADFDMRVFELLGFTLKSKYVEFTLKSKYVEFSFTVTEELDEEY